MTIAIHQPNFFPWFGYFYKIAQADTFVFLDHVEHSKASFTRRVWIHSKQDKNENQYIRIPLQKHTDHTAIHQLLIRNTDNWQADILQQLRDSYSKAPYFTEIQTWLESIFDESQEIKFMADFNIFIIKKIAARLGLQSQFVKSSSLALHGGTQVNVQICQALQADRYISGMGAKKYQYESDYLDSDITLHYSDPHPLFEKKKIPAHMHNKSILAWMMHYSTDTIKSMMLDYQSNRS